MQCHKIKQNNNMQKGFLYNFVDGNILRGTQIARVPSFPLTNYRDCLRFELGTQTCNLNQFLAAAEFSG